MTEPYHHGEIAVQTLAGERSQAILNGRVISKAIPAAARPFVRQQSYVALGWRDGSGDPWASLVVGAPGFASCDDSGTVVTIHASSADLALGSFSHEVRPADALGMLFIDLATRRRLRVNGVVERASEHEVRLVVEHAYPNCPKYIQTRERVDAVTVRPPAPPARGEAAPDDLREWLSRTDTAFLATVGPEGRVDCSHRGGRRGYMRLEGDSVLVPDYPGNSMFCSLGNMAVDPRAGLVLVDFEARLQLHLSGEASVDMTRSGGTDFTGGTRRWWKLRPRKWAVSSLAGSAQWRLLDESPFNPEVGP